MATFRLVLGKKQLITNQSEQQATALLEELYIADREAFGTVEIWDGMAWVLLATIGKQ